MEQYNEATIETSRTDKVSTVTPNSSVATANNEEPEFVFIPDSVINKMVNDTLKNSLKRKLAITGKKLFYKNT